MIWQTWRQHRGEAFAAAIVVAIFAVLAVAQGVPMHRAYERDGVAACQQMAQATDERCSEVLHVFRDRFEELPLEVAAWLPFLPVVAGILIGAPLLAREFEQGTWQLAWTQSVTKSRWLLARFALVLGGVTAASVGLAAILSWWFEPLAPHRFTPEKFNHGLLVFPSYVLLAISIGIAAGAILRRTIPAAATTLVVFLAVRVPLEFALRSNYRRPLTTTNPAEAQGWIVDDLYSGPADSLAPTNVWISYHPADRFWPFQLIEAAICTGVAAIAIVLAYRLVRVGGMARIRVRRQHAARSAAHPDLQAA
jgi:hypothetical protein